MVTYKWIFNHLPLASCIGSSPCLNSINHGSPAHNCFLKDTVTDIKKRLAVPSKSLPFLPLFNGGHKVTFPVLSGTSRWTIDCTTHKKGHKKPVLSGKPSLRFATANKLQVGDRFTLYKMQDKGGSSYYRVEVGREIHFFGIPEGGANAMGHQGLLRQPCTPYGAELSLTLAPPNAE